MLGVMYVSTGLPSRQTTYIWIDVVNALVPVELSILNCKLLLPPGAMALVTACLPSPALLPAAIKLVTPAAVAASMACSMLPEPSSSLPRPP